MIEMLMYFAMGFLVAALIALVMLPLVHIRAARLTQRRLEGAIPTSQAEVVAGKDLLRAQFAASTRQLEKRLEELGAKSAKDRAELGRKGDVINRLKTELGTLRAQLEARQAERAGSTEMPAAGAAEQMTSETSALATSTQISALSEWLAQAGAEIRTLTTERTKLESATKQFEEERSKFADFHRRAADLVRQLMAQANQEKRVNANIQELERRLAKQSQLLNQRELEIAGLQDELNVARNAEADLRVALIEIDGRANATSVEIDKLKASLDRANGERIRLAYELSNNKRRVDPVEAAA